MATVDIFCFSLFHCSFVSKLSDSIRVRSNAENTREDVAKFKEYSPEFFWLIRDVTLEITDENNKPSDIKTYLEQKVNHFSRNYVASVGRAVKSTRRYRFFHCTSNDKTDRFDVSSKCCSLRTSLRNY